ncbi:MAG: penicillin-binding protein, partial [Firmicutes bacterium]|nr:penicillin-binding protein [Bacillota bacterium]
MSDKASKDHEMEVLAEMGKLTSDLEDTVFEDASEEIIPESGAAAAALENVYEVSPVRATRSGGRASRSAHERARKSSAKSASPSDVRRARAEAKKSAEKPPKPEKPQRTKKARAEKDTEEEGGKKKKKKRLYISFWKLLLVFLLLGLTVGGIAVAMAISYAKSVVEDTPEINPGNIYDLLSENSVLNDSDGNLIEYIYSGDALRTNIEYNDMPKVLKDAFVAIEDKTFWEHHGINYVRIIGAIVDSLRRDVRISGTSTITQQLSRNLYLADIKGVRTIERKLQEIYYTFVIENALSKQQILEAYLNTIYLGYNSNGVAAAAQAYFSKDVKDLGLVESAILASLPQSPNNYAPIKRIPTDQIDDPAKYDIIASDDQYTVVYNDAGESRFKLVLRLMHEQGKIDDAQYKAAVNAKFRSFINPGESIMSSYTSSYFADYVVAEVLDDMQTYLGMTEDEARNYLYNNGLIINSTLDKRIQDIMENAYADLDNFPAVGSYDKDKEGNILDEKGNILLYNMATLFGEPDEESEKTWGDFTLREDEFEWKSNGDLKLFGGKRLNFYKTSVQGNVDYSIEFKNMFETGESDEGKKLLFSRSGGVWNIAAEYKDRDDNGDLTIKAKYFKDKPEAFTKNDDGTLTLSNRYFSLRQQVLQPQSAMVIEDFKPGQILGMIGGRGIEGKLL